MTGAIFLVGFFRGARTKDPSGVRQERSELALQPRTIQQSKLQRNIVKPARREAAIEMPQAWDEHANNGDLYVGPRLVEHEEIVPCPGGDLDTGIHLIARVVVDLKAGSRRNDRIVARDQERMIFQAQRIDTVERWLLAAAAAHHAD